jgi:hypothetical protein
METIYKIVGGGQRVQQCVQYNQPVVYEVIKNSDWPEKCQCAGQNQYTNTIWSTDLETLQAWASEWAGEKVELIEKQKTMNCKHENLDKGAARVFIAGKPVLLDLHNLKDESLCMHDAADGSYETKDGEQHFTYDNASLVAEKQGKRLFTPAESDFILQLPRRWDNERRGTWVTFDLVEGGTKELFFEAAGYRSNGGTLHSVGNHGVYLSTSPDSKSGAARLHFDFGGGLTVYEGHYRKDGYTFRFVKDIN